MQCSLAWRCQGSNPVTFSEVPGASRLTWQGNAPKGSGERHGTTNINEVFRGAG